MFAINEAKFYQYSGTPGVLEYVEMFSPFYPAVRETNKDWFQRLGDQLGQSATFMRGFIEPDFGALRLRHAWKIVIWVGIQVEGDEHICVLHIRSETSRGESNCYVNVSSHNSITIELYEGLSEFQPDAKRQVFFPVTMSESARVESTVPRVDTDEHAVKESPKEVDVSLPYKLRGTL